MGNSNTTFITSNNGKVVTTSPNTIIRKNGCGSCGSKIKKG